jgi:hypothetical protein
MDTSKFKALLDEQITWPDYYTFKFITKTEKKDQLTSYLSEHKITEKLSKNGKYTSVSSRKIMNSSDEVIEIYQTLSKVEGVITL